MKYERGSFIVVPSREKLRGMPVPAQALYMWLCAYANEDGECYPSRETLAKDCDCSKDTVDRMTKLLTDRGLLKVEKRTKNGENMTNLYSVIIWGGGRTDRPPSRTVEPPVAAQSDKELYPVLTESTEGRETRIVEIYEKEEPKKDPTAKKEYKALCDWLSRKTGVRFTALGKQYDALARARSADISPSRLKRRADELLSEEWHKQHGLDWGMVVSSFDRKA